VTTANHFVSSAPRAAMTSKSYSLDRQDKRATGVFAVSSLVLWSAERMLVVSLLVVSNLLLQSFWAKNGFGNSNWNFQVFGVEVRSYTYFSCLLYSALSSRAGFRRFWQRFACGLWLSSCSVHLRVEGGLPCLDRWGVMQKSLRQEVSQQGDLACDESQSFLFEQNSQRTMIIARRISHSLILKFAALPQNDVYYLRYTPVIRASKQGARRKSMRPALNSA
jgi:hypothetical protein